MFFEAMHPGWQKLLPVAREQLAVIEARLSGELFVPAEKHVMRAFEVDPDQVRVLIVGQDPYPTPGNANGLAFAVEPGTRPLPASLKNIFKELNADLGQPSWLDESLATWVDQGVMLLNRHLTCAPNQPGSHQDLGWAMFTESVIEQLVRLHGERLVLVLWGKQAQKLASQSAGATVLLGTHPSPLSANRGFFGSKPFSNVNEMLRKSGQPIIDWLGENVAPRF